MCENLLSIENCIKDSKIISNSVSRIATYMKNGTQLVSLYEDMMPFLLGSYYLKLVVTETRTYTDIVLSHCLRLQKNLIFNNSGLTILNICDYIVSDIKVFLLKKI